MNANEPACAKASAGRRELILKKEVFKVVGCAMEVLNELGHGRLEKPYENALAVEFGMNSQKPLAVKAVSC